MGPQAWVGTPLTLDGSSSSDSDGRIVKYEWDVDGNGTWDVVSSSPVSVTTPSAVSHAKLLLRVTDNTGATSTDSRMVDIRVDNHAPKAFLDGPATTVANQAVTFDGGRSFDPLGSIATYLWDFDSNGVVDTQGTSPRVTHAFSQAGTYKTTLTVRDFGGNTDSASLSTTVTGGSDAVPQKPVGLTAVDVPADQGGAIALAWTASTESDVSRYRVFRSLSQSGPFALVSETAAAAFTDSGLADGTIYYYVVIAVDAAGQQSANSAAASATPLDNIAPTVPVGLSAADVPADQGDAIAASWTRSAEPDLAGYRLIRLDTVTGTTVTLNVPASETECTFSGLETGHLYRFAIAAYDMAGNVSASGAPVAATPFDNLAPAAPAGLIAYDRPGDDGGAVVTEWAPNTESDLAGYTLYRGTLAQGADPATVLCLPVANLPASAVTFTDESAALGTDYVYYLVASDGSGNASGASARATTRSLDNVAPSAPMSVSASDVTPDQGGTVRVGWLPSISADVAGYRVSVLDSDGVVVKTADAGTALTYLAGGLNVGDVYTFSVVAYDAANNISDATTATQSGGDELAPATPADFSAVDVTPDQGGVIDVTWSANTESDLAGYTLTAYDSHDAVVGTYDTGFATSKTFSGLTVGDSYAFKLVARDANGNISASTAAATATAKDEIAPDAVTLSAADHAADQGGVVDISWTAAAAADAAGYKLYRDGAQIADLATLSFSDTAAGSATHSYTVRAYDGSGNLSDVSNAVALKAVDNLAPAVPSVSTVADAENDQGGVIDVTFAPVSDPDVDGYRVMCFDASGMLVATKETAALDTMAVFDHLTDGAPYHFAVLAFDTSGNASAQSVAVTGTSADNLAPVSPVNLSASDVAPDQGGSINLAWGANGESDLAGYTLTAYDAHDAVVGTVDTGLAKTHTFSGLTVGATYTFEVTARDISGNTSAACPRVSAAAADEIAPDAVTLSATDHAADQGGVVDISWTAAAAADTVGYRLYRDGAQIADLATLSFSDTAAGSATHSYTVKAYDGSGNLSVVSNDVAFKAVDNLAPAVPAGLAVTDISADQGGSLALSWTANTESDLAGYTVYRATSVDGAFTKLADVSVATFTDTHAALGATYYYAVSASDAVNESAKSGAVSGVSFDNLAPAAPAGLIAYDRPGDDGGAVVTEWAPNTESDLAGYTLYRGELAQGADAATVLCLPVANLPASAVTFTDESAALGTDYVYYLVASDGSSNASGASARATTRSLDNVAPSAPMSVSASDVTPDQGGTVRVGWLPSISADVAGYRVSVLDSDGVVVKTADTGTALTYLANGLRVGDVYTFSVVAYDAAQNISGATTADQSGKDEIAPDAPADLHAADVTPDQGGAIAVDWSANTESDLAGYTLTAYDSHDAVIGTYDVGLATSKTLSGLAVDGSFSFTLTASDVNGNVSAATAAASATANDEIAPDAVTLSAADHAADQGGAIDISWTAAAAADTAGYKLYRDGAQIADVTGTTFTDASAGSATHTYAVRAYDVSGNLSDVSNAVALKAADNLAPAVPAGLTVADVAADQGGALKVTWSANTEPDLSGYTLYRSTTEAGPFTKLADVAGTTFTDTDAALGTTYFYAVSASDAVNESAKSGAVSGSSADNVAPDAPADLHAADVTPDQGGSIAITWTANTESDLAGYTLTAFDSHDALIGTYDVGLATSKTLSGLAVDGSFSFTLTASDVNGNVSAATAAASATANDEIAPDAVTLSATDHAADQGGAIDISWTAATAADTAGYKLYRDGAQIADLATLSFSDTAAGSATRSYTVRAYDVSGNLSDVSNAVALKAADNLAPAVPAGLTVADVAADQGGALKVTWSANAEPDLSGYTLYRATSEAGPYTKLADVAGTTFTDTDAALGTTYFYAVSASDAVNESAKSGAVSGSSADNVAPDAPADLHAADVTPDQGGSISVDWSANTESDLAGYAVYRATTPGGPYAQVALTTVPTFVDTGRTDNASYYYVVTASDASHNESARSVEAMGSSRDNIAPAPPIGLGVSLDPAGGAVTLSWTAVNGAASYNVYRDGALLHAGLTQPSYRDAGLTNGQHYSYAVTALDGAAPANESSPSAAVDAMPFIPAAAPKNVTAVDTASDNGGSIDVGWDANNDGAVRYGVRLFQQGVQVGSTKMVTATVGPRIGVSITGLTNGLAYTASVSAFDAMGTESQATPAAAAATPVNDLPPTTPVGLTAQDVPFDQGGHISVSWTPLADTDLDHFVVYRSTSAAGPFVSIAQTSSATFVDGSVTDGLSYFYRVTAVDTAGNVSGTSATVQGVSSSGLVPGSATRIENTDSSIAYTGVWFQLTGGIYTAASGGSVKLTQMTNGFCTYTFTGSQITWITLAGKGQGIANVYIDGVLDKTVDCYDASADYVWQSARYTKTFLAGGTHTIKIEESGFKNPLSTGYYVDVDAFDVAVFVDTEAPSAPASLSASGVGLTSIALSWAPSSDNVGVTGYRIERSSDGGSTWSQVGTSTATSTTDTVQPLSIYYRYRVRAFDKAGSLSGYSPIAAATTMVDTEAPTAPTSFVASATAFNRVALTWAASTDNLGVTGYRVDRSSDNGASWSQIGTSTAPSYADTTAHDATTYNYRVRANDAAGNLSAYSNAATVTTPIDPAKDLLPPSVPTGLITFPQYRSMSVTWTASTDDAAVMGYRLERSTNGGSTWTQIADTGSTGFKDTGLADASTYSYRVRAYDVAGHLSGYSAVVTAQTPVRIENTDASVNYSGTYSLVTTNAASGGSLKSASSANASSTYTFVGTQISWISMAGKTQGIAKVYIDGVLDATVDCYASADAWQANMYTKTFATPGTHTIKVENTGTQNPSSSGSNTAMDALDVVVFHDTQAPTTPSGLTATGTGARNVALSWTPATDDMGVTGYRIERSPDGGATWAQIGTSTSTTYADASGQPLTTYTYRVRANDSWGNLSDYSATAAATTQADTDAPTTPGSLVAIATTFSKVTLNWTASTDNVAVTGYLVERSQDGGATWTQVGIAPSPSFADTPVMDRTTFTYRIRATDGAGNLSGYSATASATTPLDPSKDITPPTVPTGLAVFSQFRSLRVTWTASTDDIGVAGYKLERSANGGSTWTQIADTVSTAATDTGLADDTTYQYRARAYDQVGHLSAYSVVASSRTAVRIENTDTNIAYTGVWYQLTGGTYSAASGGSLKLTQMTNGYCTYQFTGTQITWVTLAGKNQGIANVYIDGVLDTTVDCYDPADYVWQAARYSKTFPTSGTHTIKVEQGGTKNPLSAGYYVDVDAFDITH